MASSGLIQGGVGAWRYFPRTDAVVKAALSAGVLSHLLDRVGDGTGIGGGGMEVCFRCGF